MPTPSIPEFWPMSLGENADVVSIPEQTPVGEGTPSFQGLFPVLTAIDPAAGGYFIEREWMNGLFQLLGKNAWYLQHGALYPWNETFTYPQGAHVLGSDNHAYVAKQESTGQNPTEEGVGEYWQDLTTMLSGSYLPLEGGTMTGPLTLSGAPTSELQAVTKQYVDEATGKAGQPVGAIYVQYGGQETPEALFGGQWQDISETYAGRFFRVAGGDAAAFGEDQEGGAPNISGTVWFDGATVYEATASTSCFYQASTKRGHPYGGGSAHGDLGFSAQRSNALYGAATEIRPINHSIRIWKRTA